MYDKLGGKAGIAQLVDEFYRIMETDSRAQAVFATHHGRDIKISAQKLKAFLSGWTGGPQEYLETYGHPRLRMRHSLFRITRREAQEWILCMREALSKTDVSAEHQAELVSALEGVAQMLINRE